MDDRDRLLHAIAAAPEDDLARLAYADWLEENGDETRAEFVRVSVAIEAQGGQYRCEGALWDRSLKLERANERAWEADLPPWLRFLPKYERGVLHAVHITAGNFLKHGRTLFRRFPTVRVVRFINDAGRWAELAACRAFGSIPGIEVDGSQVEESLTALVGSPWTDRLQSFVPKGGPGALSSVFAEALRGSSGFNGLRSLVLPFIALDEAVVREMTAERFPSLCRFDSTGVLGPHLFSLLLSGLLAQPSLASLVLERSGLGDEGAALLAAGSLSGLETLGLANNDIGPEGALALARADFPRLRSLDLNDNRIGTTALTALLALPSLVHLDLTYSELEDEAIIRLAEHPGAAKLEDLRLAYVPVGDRGVEAIARSGCLSELTVLDLSSGVWTDEGAFALALSPHLGKLRTLIAFHTAISDRGKAALRERFSVWGA